MGDTARNTEKHMSGWGSSKLRDQGISFVSAGTLHQELEHVRAQEHEIEDKKDIAKADVEQGSTATLIESSIPTMPDIKIEPAVQHEPVYKETVALADKFSIRPRSASQSSSSSAEQIVFTGRSKGPTPNPASLNASKKPSRAPTPVKSIPFRDHIAPAPVAAAPVATKPISIGKDTTHIPDLEASSSDRRVMNSRLRRRGRGGSRRQSDLDEQEAIMRDYIANMAMDDSEEDATPVKPSTPQPPSRWAKVRKNETFRYYDGAGEENEKVQILGPKKKQARDTLDQAMDWNSDDMKDFDDLSTTDEEVEEISQVLRHRERKNGLQYLVTPLGLETGDAKWVLQERLVSESARKEIAIFEEIQAMELEEDSYDEDDDEIDDDETTDSEAEEALNDLIEHIESEDDENARIMKHTAKMTDEQIARALAKQEELGMGGDELMLFSGDVDGEEEEELGLADAFGRNDDFISFSLKQHTSNRARSKRNKKSRDSFPSAAAFADALDEDPYGAFDVMDFDRPSLRPKKKGRKSDFPYDLELEDEDLREQLVSTWTKDRDKKLQRKRAKEEARMSALLEYADRSEPAAIKAEIRRFLIQEVDTLRLSPMESSIRASVHRLAKALKLNSHSEGKEGTPKGRYPVLTKTIRTPSYTIDTVWEVDALLNTRKFFPRNTTSYKKDKLPRGTARATRMRSSGGVQGASYTNGEIVGASAPEIGADNKGRAMLEKMGWTSGMAIGAEGNKGSLDVVRHVFKTSRAGLG